MVRNLQRMRSLGKSFSQHASSSGKQTLKKCSSSGEGDNFVLIDVDGDFPNIIVIDVPESVQKKLRKPSPRTVISIDDDEVTGGDCSNDNDSTSSSRCSLKPMYSSNSAKENGSRNHYGLGSESETGSAGSDCSDCECMDGPVEKLREQWELASRRRKTAVHIGLSSNNQASMSGSHLGCHSDPGAGNAAKISNASAQSSPTYMRNKEKSFPFAEHAFGNSLNNDYEHDPSNDFARTFPDQVTSSLNIGHDMGTGSLSMENNSSKHAEKPHYVDVDIHLSSFCGNEHGAQEPVVDTTELNNSMNYPFEDLEAKISGEPCLYNRQPSFDEQFDCDMSETMDGDQTIYKPQLSVDADRECSTVASMDVLPASGLFSTRSGKTTNSSAEANSGAVLNTFRKFKSYNKVEVAEKNAAPCRELEIASLHNHQKAVTGYRFCHSVQTEADGSTSEPLNGLRFDKTNEVLQDLGGKPCDIITNRQKIKETDEYKRAMEELSASRQQQLQIQAEEAQRLRRRKRAESMRIMDMERRQKQRLEEMRETQKKDEENLSVKEQLRVGIREELNQVERSCRDMASLLRRLGLHVGGGFFPSQNEVQAAYKRALLKFHPDRASRSDIRQQVEAEEKFKLISRMKEKFTLAG